MKKHAYFILVVAFYTLVTSCNPLDYFKYYTVYLRVQDLNGLKEGAVVLSKGNQVGKVAAIHNEEDNFHVVAMTMDNDFLIPVNSEVRVVSDIENTSAYLEVLMSHSKNNYAAEDTIHSQGAVLLNKDIQLEEVKIPLDSLPEGIRSLMQ